MGVLQVQGPAPVHPSHQAASMQMFRFGQPSRRLQRCGGSLVLQIIKYTFPGARNSRKGTQELGVQLGTPGSCHPPLWLSLEFSLTAAYPLPHGSPPGPSLPVLGPLIKSSRLLTLLFSSCPSASSCLAQCPSHQPGAQELRISTRAHTVLPRPCLLPTVPVDRTGLQLSPLLPSPGMAATHTGKESMPP